MKSWLCKKMDESWKLLSKLSQTQKDKAPRFLSYAQPEFKISVCVCTSHKTGKGVMRGEEEILNEVGTREISGYL